MFSDIERVLIIPPKIPRLIIVDNYGQDISNISFIYVFFFLINNINFKKLKYN